MMKLTERDKKDIVLRWYDEASLNGNAEAARAWLDGVFFVLSLDGMDYVENCKLEDELRDLMDAYIEGEWEDDAL